jgi:hypothetical protein
MARVCSNIRQQRGSRAQTAIAAIVSRRRFPKRCERQPVGFEPGGMLEGG